MDNLLITLVGVLIGISLVILYFQLKAKPKQEDNPTEKIQEEINNLRNSLNQSIIFFLDIIWKVNWLSF